MHPQSTRVPRTCATCGKEFFVYPSAIRRGVGKYCSLSCRSSRKGTPEQRFWSHVKKTDTCWLWMAGIVEDGYGIFSGPGRKSIRAHRFSWILHNGPIPDGLNVLHNCPGGDNPSCVNPSHLWLGTIADNNRDCSQKGRAATGNKNGSHTNPERRPSGDRHGSRTKPESTLRGNKLPQSKLTDNDVIEIRSLYASKKVTLKQLASQFGLHLGSIHKIVTGKTWKHLLPVSPGKP